MKISALGLAWYRREDYPRILRTMRDGRKLPRTFEEWEKNATLIEKCMLAQRHATVRVVLFPDEFVKWCRKKRKMPNARARGYYIAEVTKEKPDQAKPTG